MTEKKDRKPNSDATPKAQDEPPREVSVEDVETEGGEDVKGGGYAHWYGNGLFDPNGGHWGTGSS